MTILAVTYAGATDAWFDREYYRTHHLPLVKQTWGPCGLETISAFYPDRNDSPAGEGTGMIAVCLCGSATRQR